MKGLLLLLLLFCITARGAHAQKQGQARLDSLLAELPKAKEDTNKVNLLNEVSLLYYWNNPTEGIRYGEQGLALAEKLGWKKGIASACRSLGANFGAQSDYPKALEYQFKSIKIYEEIGNKAGIARNLLGIGAVYFRQSKNAEALEYYLKALKLGEELGDKYIIAVSIGNIGNIYHAQSNYPKALEYHLKALKINEETGNKTLVALNLGKQNKNTQYTHHPYRPPWHIRQ